MATLLQDTLQFTGISNTGSTTGYAPMSVIGGAFNWYEAWSLTHIAASCNTTFSALENNVTLVSCALATLITQLVRKGILPSGTISGF